jgi:hypothetical protein
MIGFCSAYFLLLWHEARTKTKTIKKLHQSFRDYALFHRLSRSYKVVRGDEDTKLENITFTHSAVAMVLYNIEDVPLLAKLLNTEHPSIFFVGNDRAQNNDITGRTNLRQPVIS